MYLLLTESQQNTHFSQPLLSATAITMYNNIIIIKSSGPSYLKLHYVKDKIAKLKQRNTMLRYFAAHCNYRYLYLAACDPGPCKTGWSETDCFTDCCLIKRNALLQPLHEQELIPFLNHSVSCPRATWIIQTKLIF